MAITGISSIHLLKTCIRVVFLLSAMAIACTDRIMMNTQSENQHH